MYIHLRPPPAVSHSLTVSFPLITFLHSSSVSLFYVRRISSPSVFSLSFSLFPSSSFSLSLSLTYSSRSSRCTMDLHETPLWISTHLCSVSLLYVTLSKSVTSTHTNVHTRCHLRFFILYIYIYIYTCIYATVCLPVYTR